MRHDSTPDSDCSADSERTSSTPPVNGIGHDPVGGLLFSELASRYLANRELIGLKRTTLMDYGSYTRVHLVPAFGDFELEEITIDLIEEFIAAKRHEGKAVKSVLNYLGLLHAMFAFAFRRGWCAENPVALVEKPRGRRNLDIRFLDVQELEALLAATPTDDRGLTERVLYLTAAMTGLRRGELLALRWQDIDWSAGVVRVRRNYTRGQFGSPKSRRSSRAVPLAQRVRDELRTHYERSRFQAAPDLVFPHPELGVVLDPAKLRKRFQTAARRAGLRPVRFHDLRHTFGTRMAAAGAPLRWIQEWLGHSDYRTTSLYADYAPDLSQAVQWAARAFDNASPDIDAERIIHLAVREPRDGGALRDLPDQRLRDLGLVVEHRSGTKVLVGEHAVRLANDSGPAAG
jgi:integrase